MTSSVAGHTLALGLAALGMATACHQETRSAARRPAPPATQSPLQQEPASSTGAFLTPDGDTALKYQFVTRDSAGLQDLGGYYGPTDTVADGGLELRWIEIETLNFYYGGSLHYDRPQVYVPPFARMSYEKTGTDEGGQALCTNAMITADSLSLRCKGTPLGDVSIDGHLLGGGNKDKLRDGDLALVARVVMRRGERVTFDRVCKFQYLEGD
jgi:hypothetical protein